MFGRRGRNLTLTVPVSYPEAALGTTLTVPTLTEPGHPAGPARHARRAAPSGSRAEACRPASGAPTGDLLVTVEVEVPDTLTDEQREAVEALATVVEPPARDATGSVT